MAHGPCHRGVALLFCCCLALALAPAVCGSEAGLDDAIKIMDRLCRVVQHDDEAGFWQVWYGSAVANQKGPTDDERRRTYAEHMRLLRQVDWSSISADDYFPVPNPVDGSMLGYGVATTTVADQQYMELMLRCDGDTLYYSHWALLSSDGQERSGGVPVGDVPCDAGE